MNHPARNLPFDELYDRLRRAVANGGIHETIGENGLRLYTYSDATVYERRWHDITLMSRGLIIDIDKREVIATPFPKFFNLGELQNAVPDLPFEIFEKLDGSLIIIFYHNGNWRCATKGSFISDQAIWAQRWLEENIATQYMDKTFTYLAEAIYPQNRIVVDYKEKMGLALLAIYHSNGIELPYEHFKEYHHMGWGIVKREEYSSISDLLERAGRLDHNSEGWVIRFSDGMRIKIKGDEYCRIHRMIANLTPLAIWRQLLEGASLEDTRRSLPEEFLGDFDLIVRLLTLRLEALLGKIETFGKTISGLTDKEVGLQLTEVPSDIRSFIFPYRKGTLGDGRSRRGLFEAIRPNRNVLEGYRASSSMARIQENIKE